MKRLTNEEINKAAEGSFLPSHRERVVAEAQLQADQDAVKASREKIAIFLEEHDDLSYTFSWKADQIIKMQLGDEE